MHDQPTRTKRLFPVIALPVLAMFAGTMVLAADTVTLDALDSNGDGTLSYGEMLIAMPNLTEAGFTEMDADADQAIDADELAAAISTGLLAPAEG